MGMDPKYGVKIIILLMYLGPLELSPLTFKVYLRKIRIEDCLEEDMDRGYILFVGIHFFMFYLLTSGFYVAYMFVEKQALGWNMHVRSVFLVWKLSPILDQLNSQNCLKNMHISTQIGD